MKWLKDNLKFVMTVGALVVGGLYGWWNLNQTVKTNTESIIKIDNRVSRVESVVSQLATTDNFETLEKTVAEMNNRLISAEATFSQGIKALERTTDRMEKALENITNFMRSSGVSH